MQQTLVSFKELLIDKKTLQEKLGEDLYNIDCKAPEVVNTADVIATIESYFNHKISKEQLVEWVNVVWFTELFEICETEADSIISVLQVLETLDEEDADISEKELYSMISSLKNNAEYE